MSADPPPAQDPAPQQEPGVPGAAGAPPATAVGAGTSPADAPWQALPQHKLRRTRLGGVWTALACFAIVLLLLLIFILQNSHTVDVSYFGAHGHLPLGVALLLAAVCGALLVVIAGAARILQLRATARRHQKTDARRGTKENMPRARSR